MAKLATLEIGDGLADFFLRIHDEWTVADDGLVGRFAALTGKRYRSLPFSA